MNVLNLLLFALLAAPAAQAAIILDAARPVNLNWSDTNTTGDGFILERNLNAGAYQVLATSTTAKLTTYVDAGVVQSPTVDNIYCYRVAAYNKQGQSAYSVIDCATIKRAAPLSPPTGLTVSAIDSQTLEISWAVEDIAITTELQRRAARSKSIETVIILAGDTDSYRDIGIPPRSTKCYRARHIGILTASQWSSLGCAKTR